MHRSSRTLARRLTLAPHPAAVPWVRRLTRQMLEEQGLEELSDTVLLLVSELVTNAVRASANRDCPAGGPDQNPDVTLTLERTARTLLIAVWDSRPDPAVLQRPDTTTDCGRGLLIVEALASRWGQRAVDGGKEVWCEVALVPARARNGLAFTADVLPGTDCSRQPALAADLAAGGRVSGLASLRA